MRDGPSLTDAVKEAGAPGPSLTDVVKGAAGVTGGAAEPEAEGHHEAAAPAAAEDDATIAPDVAPSSVSEPTAAPADPAAPRVQVGAWLRRFGFAMLAGGARFVAVALLAALFTLAATTGTGAPPEAAARGAVAQPKRVALVVGNSAYQHTPGLPNPRHDATDMSAVLRQLGWQVIEGFDLDKAGFDRKIREFSAALQGAEAGVFYYAGHGLQVAGHNYLVPVDAQLTTASALDFEMVRLDVVHRAMEGAAQANILIIDACRDNPLSRNLARALDTRSTEVGRGLAAVEGGIGTLVSFSTQPGNVALDGKGRNSPFTGALVRHVAGSHDDLSAVLIAVRNDVVKATGRRQVPWEHSALTARFHFNPAPLVVTAAVPPQLRLSEAAEAWSATRDIANIAVLDAFAVRFTHTFYAELARARIEDLRKQDAPQW